MSCTLCHVEPAERVAVKARGADSLAGLTLTATPAGCRHQSATNGLCDRCGEPVDQRQRHGWPLAPGSPLTAGLPVKQLHCAPYGAPGTTENGRTCALVELCDTHRREFERLGWLVPPEEDEE